MKKSVITSLLCGTIALISPTIAMAQAAPASTSAAEEADTGALQDIVVTARKRTETLLNVPVVATAVSGDTLLRMQTNDLKALATMVPGLSLGTSILSVGTLVSLRGVGTSALDPGVDASVTLNIDGLALSQGLAYAAGMFDVGQIEVLKGPQNLFYGKSSPGGVISLRTKDPTDKFEVIGRAGYEIEAKNRVVEGIISGPIGESVKARLAVQYNDLDGFFKNSAHAIPNTGAAGPSSPRNGGGTSYKIRGTLLFNPSPVFDARIKLNRVVDRIHNAGAIQNVNCPEGVTAPLGRFYIDPTDKCKLDRVTPSVDMDPNSFPGIPFNGVPTNDTVQTFGTAELNFHVSPQLTVTSQTGYYNVHAKSLFNATGSSAAMGLFDAVNDFHRRQFTQELRAASDFDSPLNFTAGALIERGKFSDDVTIGRNLIGVPLVAGTTGVTSAGVPILPAGAAPTAIYVQRGNKHVKINTESVYGQLLYKISSQLEIAAGARWTDERRSEVGTFITPLTGVSNTAAFARPNIAAKNIAPEISLTYHPNTDTTVFANLKKGYKSGSFNVSTPPFNGENNSFNDEQVKGGELGFKTRSSDRRLQFNAAAFYYKYAGLQVGANVQATAGVTVTRTVNAGSARSYGLEGDVTFRPEGIDGLTLTLAALYNNTKYTSLTNLPCYGGQLVSEGCNLLFVPSAAAAQTPTGPTGGVFTPNTAGTPGGTTVGGVYGFWGFYTAQNRSGLPLIRAPKISGNASASYDVPMGSTTLVLGTNIQYQSKSLVNLGYIWYQNAYAKLDLSATLKGPDDKWEFAIVGKNIANTITTGNCSNGNRAGGNAGGAITGGVVRGVVGIDEVGCWADTGRELWLRATIKY